MPTDVTLRPATEDDHDAVAAVYLSARRQAAMPPLVHSEDAVRSWISGRLQSHDETWVAEVGGTVGAYARMADVWLDDLYVAPPYAGQGVGSALLDLVKARRPDGFCLWVFEVNTRARTFYARHGLVELEHTNGSTNEERAPDLKMAWPGADPVAFLRSLIDEVDDQLGDLLARRVALTRVVQHHKPDRSRDPAREAEIARRMARHAPELGADRLRRIVHTIVTESLDTLEPDG
jgi:GNAT superfamily N-acetyltransferase/chorismate mutase